MEEQEQEQEMVVMVVVVVNMWMQRRDVYSNNLSLCHHHQILKIGMMLFHMLSTLGVVTGRSMGAIFPPRGTISPQAPPKVQKSMGKVLSMEGWMQLSQVLLSLPLYQEEASLQVFLEFSSLLFYFLLFHTLETYRGCQP